MNFEIYLGLFIIIIVITMMDVGLGFIFALIVLCLGEPDLLDILIQNVGK